MFLANSEYYLRTDRPHATVFDDADDVLTGATGLDWFLLGEDDEAMDLSDEAYAIAVDLVLSDI